MTNHLLALLLLAATPPSPAPYKSMAYNVLYDAPPEDVEKSLDVIEREKPDLLCLRELTAGFAKAFRKRLGKEFPHTTLEPQKGTWGVGIASRHPLLRTERFPQRPHRMPPMEVDVRLGGRRLKVVCAHLRAPGRTPVREPKALERSPHEKTMTNAPPAPTGRRIAHGSAGP